MAYTEDGAVVYPAGHNVVIYSSETKTQRLIHGTLESEGITALCVSANKKLLAVAERSEKAMITVYDLQTLKRRKVLTATDAGSKVRKLPGVVHAQGPALLHFPRRTYRFLIRLLTIVFITLHVGVRQPGVLRGWQNAAGARRGPRMEPGALGVGEVEGGSHREDHKPAGATCQQRECCCMLVHGIRGHMPCCKQCLELHDVHMPPGVSCC